MALLEPEQLLRNRLVTLWDQLLTVRLILSSKNDTPSTLIDALLALEFELKEYYDLG